ncbi:unnamed protein product [Caenorhabditis auriculariae]|uniref:Uncharacterized protein n=1 Tax=Caenorhabditis auriculariae TaxID=2777116 RepID=A0A8S1H3M0_9PELO|nr:unnamed protein product [Caenorhabditis auriculariae]
MQKAPEPAVPEKPGYYRMEDVRKFIYHIRKKKMLWGDPRLTKSEKRKSETCHFVELERKCSFLGESGGESARDIWLQLYTGWDAQYQREELDPCCRITFIFYFDLNFLRRDRRLQKKAPAVVSEKGNECSTGEPVQNPLPQQEPEVKRKRPAKKAPEIVKIPTKRKGRPASPATRKIADFVKNLVGNAKVELDQLSDPKRKLRETMTSVPNKHEKFINSVVQKLTALPSAKHAVAKQRINQVLDNFVADNAVQQQPQQ